MVNGESGIGNRESGIGNRESGIGNREITEEDKTLISYPHICTFAQLVPACRDHLGLFTHSLISL
jgi:hypothetical protein